MAQYRIDTNAWLTANRTIFEGFVLSDKDGNIINSFGDAANIPIAAGQVAGYSVVHKFGLVDGTASGALSTIWSPADTAGTLLYPWSFSAGTISANSTSGDDTSAGVGTQTITVEGLDANYALQSDTITLSGTTHTGESTKSFTRVFRAYAATGETNVGKISINVGGAAGTKVAEIPVGYGQTLMSVYTVPAGKTAYLSNLRVSSAKQQSTIIRLMVRPFGGVFRAQSTISLYSGSGETQFVTPLKITEKSDIDVRTTGGTNNTLSCDFDMILVDNS